MAKTSVDLFRSVTKEDFPDGTVLDGKPTPGVLFPDFVDRPLPSGTIRRADVHQTAMGTTGSPAAAARRCSTAQAFFRPRNGPPFEFPSARSSQSPSS